MSIRSFKSYFSTYLLSLPLARWNFLKGRFVKQTGPVLQVTGSIVLLLQECSVRITLTEPNAGLFSLVGVATAVTGIGALIIGAEMLATLTGFFSSPGVLLLLKKLNRPVYAPLLLSCNAGGGGVAGDRDTVPIPGVIGIRGEDGGIELASETVRATESRFEVLGIMASRLLNASYRS